MEYPRFYQSITFCIIILNHDQWVRYYVKSSILALVAVLFSRAELVGQFIRGPYKKQVCEIILNSDQWFRRSRRLRIFLSIALAIILFGGAEPLKAIIEEGTMRNISVKLFLN